MTFNKFVNIVNEDFIYIHKELIIKIVINQNLWIIYPQIFRC